MTNLEASLDRIRDGYLRYQKRIRTFIRFTVFVAIGYYVTLGVYALYKSGFLNDLYTIAKYEITGGI